MDRLTEFEKTILELTRQHIRNENELINRLKDPKLKPLNEKTLQAWVSDDHRPLSSTFWASSSMRSFSAISLSFLS